MSVRFSMLAVLTAIGLLANVASADDGVLYWMVGEGATVSGSDIGTQDIETYLSAYENATEGSWSAARVRVIGGDSDTFLDLYTPGGSMPGADGIDFDDFGDAWGAGVPDGVQSAISSGTPEYSFIIELGNVTDSRWTTVAQSSSKTYAQLADAGFIRPTFNMNPPASAIWSPGQFQAVPEPSGGLLTLMGIALLALRRRRMGEVA